MCRQEKEMKKEGGLLYRKYPSAAETVDAKARAKVPKMRLEQKHSRKRNRPDMKDPRGRQTKGRKEFLQLGSPQRLGFEEGRRKKRDILRAHLSVDGEGTDRGLKGYPPLE